MTTTLNGEILNDLLRINSDRILGYERAIAGLDDMEDMDLKNLFLDYLQSSKAFIAELTGEIKKLGEPIAAETSGMGKIYRAWVEIKAFFTGHDRQTILNSCEAVEDAVKKAYESALNHPGLYPDVFLVIEDQSNKLLKAHQKIKQLRDSWL